MVTKRKGQEDTPTSEEELGQGSGMWEGEASKSPGGEIPEEEKRPQKEEHRAIDELPPPVAEQVRKPKGPKADDIFDFVGAEPDFMTFTLPSRGVMYGGISTIEVRPFKTAEEKLLASLTPKNWNPVINKVIKQTLGTDLDPKEVTIGDRLTLLVWLRIQTYGSIYSATVTCPACKKKSKENIDLNELEPEMVDESLVVPETITLKATKAKVTLELMCNRHEMEAEEFLDRQSQMVAKSQGNDLWFLRYASTIIGITKPDGVELEALTMNLKKKFLEKIPPRDFAQIRYWHAKNDHGVDLRFDFECKICNNEAELAVPMELDFFLPTRSMQGNAGD